MAFPVFLIIILIIMPWRVASSWAWAGTARFIIIPKQYKPIWVSSTHTVVYKVMTNGYAN